MRARSFDAVRREEQDIARAEVLNHAPQLRRQVLTGLGRRLRDQLRDFNACKQRRYSVDLSIGATLVDGPADLNLEEFIARADEAMYQEKRAASGRDS